ncbi:rod shape-determining protein MreC [Mangrovibacterium marinum]|uniref:Cell shape-determining protein MreC n=1 Tax=Mangrovibacterium marinum TaxID=1639118 RepID=A0A2T5BXT5_9BACT|nr:rod shape-determining protein MreC [Mangrovibacterium marinum]PTN05964.1 rod shape-determining protein MreC [Mangrovibacterium marinum]
MRGLLRFLARNYFILLFLLFEAISIGLLVNYNNFQRVKFFNSSNSLIASVYKSFNAVSSFFHLQQSNADLAQENARLRTMLEQYRQSTVAVDSTAIVAELTASDSVDLRYEFIPAKVINNSFVRQYNYITLSKGSDDGVKVDMGIIGPGGVVGIITSVSRHYATGPTILNKRWKVSAKIQNSNYFGSLAWDGQDPHYARLNEIPFHVQMAVGDTIVTSGFSDVFPEGVPIGTIETFDHASGRNFFAIKVKLLTNFANLSFVEIVKNNHLEELEQLQELNTDE